MSLIDYRLSYILTLNCDQLLNDQVYIDSNLSTPSNTFTFDSNKLNSSNLTNLSLPIISTYEDSYSKSNSIMSTSQQFQFNLNSNSSLQATALLNTLNKRPIHHDPIHSDHHLHSISSSIKPEDEVHFAFLNQHSSSSSPPTTRFVQSTDFLSGSPAPSSTPHQISLLKSISTDPNKKTPNSTLPHFINLDPINQNLLPNHHLSSNLLTIISSNSNSDSNSNSNSNHQIPIINSQSDKLIPMSSTSSSNQISSQHHIIDSQSQNELSTINNAFINTGSSTLSPPQNIESLQTSSQLPSQDQIQSQNQITTPSSTLATQTSESLIAPDPMIPKPITTSYMAINFLNEIKLNQIIQPKETPTKFINQNMITSSHSPQSITISISSPNYESLYQSNSKIIPITLFPSLFKFSNGKKVAVDGFISYATKVGRIRVIDQISGARMLLRKHEGIVIDMSIGKPNEGKRWRCIGSIGTDRRLVIWKVPNRFEEETANYEVLIDLVLKDQLTKFINLKWHPKDSTVFLVSIDDKRLVLIRLDRAGFLGIWKRGIGMGRTISELEGFEGQDIIQTNSNVVGFCFSPDGSAFAYVTEDGLITVRETLKPHWTIMGGQLSGTKPITKIEFITSFQTNKPIGFLISRDQGRLLEIVSLTSISKPKISIEFLVPEEEEEQEQEGLGSECFGDSNWLNKESTILVSNSLRGSIYGFKLKVNEEENEENSRMMMMNDELNKSQTQSKSNVKIEEDSIYIEGRRNQQTEEKIFVERIGEISTSDPIISFVIDEGSMNHSSSSSNTEISTFNIHPKGIHQLFLPKDFLQPEGFQTELEIQTNKEEGEGMYRRKSLAGEILVDVDVREESIEKKEGEEDLMEINKMSTTRIEVIEKGVIKKEIIDLNSKDQSTSDLVNHHKDKTSFTRTLEVGKSGENLSGVEMNSLGNQINENCLKKLEESLLEKMSKMFIKQVNQLETKFEKEKIEEKLMENERQMKLIELISNSLEINLKKVLKDLIINEIETKVLPEILGLVQQTIKKEINQLILSPSPTTPLPMINIPNTISSNQLNRLNNSINSNSINSYEDIFLSTLSNESNLTINELIELYSLEEVFKIGLSQPVLLTLSHHLSQSLKFKDQLEKDEMNRLRWIWKSIDSIDVEDHQTGMYVGRVLDLVCDGLLEFKRVFDQFNYNLNHPNHQEHPNHPNHPNHQEHPNHPNHPNHQEHPNHPNHQEHHGNVSIGIDEVLKLVIEKKNKLRIIEN